MGSLLYVVSAFTFAECAAFVESGGQATNTVSPGVKIAVMHPRFPESPLYCCRLARMCLAASDRRT